MDELELAGLTPVASKLVKPPRVAESVVQLECKLRGTHEIKNAKGESTGRIMIGEVCPSCVTSPRCLAGVNCSLHWLDWAPPQAGGCSCAVCAVLPPKASQRKGKANLFVGLGFRVALRLCATPLWLAAAAWMCVLVRRRCC